MIAFARWLLAFAAALAAGAAWAEFHTYKIDQIYSNASGTVQYIVMRESSGADQEYFWQGNMLASTKAGGTTTYTFPNNLPVSMAPPPPYPYPPYVAAQQGPSSTANTKVLIATQGFAALNLIAPDYVVPNGFLSSAGGTLNYAGVDQVTYPALPTDGSTALNRAGAPTPAVATNFIGQSVAVTAPAAAVNYQGLWWAGPAESGWGINFAHQGDVIFATWFTYDTTGKAWWLTMTANKVSDGVYSGQLMQTTGAPFNAYVPPANGTAVGTGTITFTSATTASFNYTVNGVTQAKALALQAFGPVPTCVFGAQPNLTLATNYQDLWWATGGTESGWGVNLTQQGLTIFATWFTYDVNRNPIWYSATAPQTSPQTFSGPLIKTSGPAFSATPFDGSQVQRTTVGTVTFVFTNGDAGSFTYSVADGANTGTQTKTIERQVFRAPGTVCQ
jgi:hypothetical protein